MNKTFSDIVTNVCEDVIDTSTAFKAIVKDYANNRYFQILRSINWTYVRYDYTFNTVASTQTYALPSDFYKPISVRDTTNGVEVTETDWQRLVTDFPSSVTSTGDVTRYAIVDDTVSAQPTSASVIAISSSSASDTTQTVTVRGISSGVEVYEAVTLTGTSPASTTNSYTRVKGVSKSATTVGYITLTSNSAAVTVATLAPTATTSNYKLMKLHYVPSSVITISAPYIVKPMPMVSDYDYPVIEIADLIEIGAKADAWRYKKQFAKASVLENLFLVEINRYLWDMDNKPNMVPQFYPTTYNKDDLF